MLKTVAVEQPLEAITVLGQVDGVGRGTDDGNTGVFQGAGQFKRRLAAKLDDDAEQLTFRCLQAGDLDNMLGGQRFEIEPV